MSIITTRAQRRELERTNAKLPRELRPVPRDEWPNPNGPQRRVWRSRDYLVQEFDAPDPACVRLSINRTTLTGDRWNDNLTWDELQDIKAQCGWITFDAVEVYPPAGDVVNVANMRHLWVLRDPLPFAWRKGRQ
jgi:hypothetical protein